MFPSASPAPAKASTFTTVIVGQFQVPAAAVA
jgi:hypothetical protein